MVYTNISSNIQIKSLLNCSTGSFIDTNSISDNYDIETHTIIFRDTGLDRGLKTERYFGDTVVTTISKATSLEVNLQLLIDNDDVNGATIQTVIANLGNMEDTSLTTDGTIYNYSETDTKRRHRIALTWNDNDGNSYMKVYYNAYVKTISLEKDTALTINVAFEVPIMDIETGNGNYYEYEGGAPADSLLLIDEEMKWA